MKKRNVWKVLLSGALLFGTVGCTGTAKNVVQTVGNTAAPTGDPGPTLDPGYPTATPLTEDVDLMKTDVFAGTYWQGIYYEESITSQIDGTYRTVLPKDGMNYELYLREDGTALFTDYDRDGNQFNTIDGYWMHGNEPGHIIVSKAKDGSASGPMETLYFEYRDGELTVSYGGAFLIHMTECSDTARTDAAMLKAYLSGAFMKVDAENPDTVEIANVRYANGILALEGEYRNADSDETWAYWTKEFWPYDDSLTSTSAKSVRGIMASFSTMWTPRYTDVKQNVTLEVTEDGFALTEWIDDFNSTTEYYKAIRSTYRCHSTDEELGVQLPATITRPESLVGSYAMESEKEGIFLSLYKDGRVTLLHKPAVSVLGEEQDDERLLWAQGVWGVNENGNMQVVMEQIGGGTHPLEMEWVVRKDGTQLVLESANSESFPGSAPVALKETDENRKLSRNLISNWHSVVTILRLESGEYEERDGSMQTYYFELPKVNEDTAGAQSINKKIYEEYTSKMDAAMTAMVEQSTVGISHIYCFSMAYDNVYAIVVYFEENMTGQTYYSAYYYDVNTGKELDVHQYLKRMGIEEEEFLTQLRTIAVATFEFQNEGLTEEQKRNAAYEQVKDSIGGYIDMTTTMPYVSAYGEVLAIAPLACLAGPAYRYQVFMVTGLSPNVQ